MRLRQEYPLRLHLVVGAVHLDVYEEVRVDCFGLIALHFISRGELVPQSPLPAQAHLPILGLAAQEVLIIHTVLKGVYVNLGRHQIITILPVI